jgi:hypothetical protein
LWIAWAAGAIYGAPGAYYLAGLAVLAKLDASASTEVLSVLGFNLIMFALIELPLLGFVLAPDRTVALTTKLHGWMTAHRRILIVIVARAGGAYLLISGCPTCVDVGPLFASGPPSTENPAVARLLW